MLIINSEQKIFDLAEISRGNLIYAKHSSWDDGVSGIVTEASEKRLRIQFLPSIRNVMNHTYVYASEVVDGQWIIRWSPDGLINVYSCEPAADPDDSTEDEGDGEDGGT